MAVFDVGTSTQCNRVYILSLLLVVFQLVMANTAILPIPLVDGWAVWNRAMHLKLGEVDWATYLFAPHGAHPHAIVYLIAWFDFYWGYAQQTIMKACSFLAIMGCALFAVKRAQYWLSRGRANPLVVIVASLAVAAIITSLSDYETMMQPFQVVMSVSRLVYFLLLWQLIKVLRVEHAAGYVLTVALSCVAVTFHGTGYIFSIVFLLVHLFFATRVYMCVGALLPMASLWWLQKNFSVGGSELSHLGELLNLGFIVPFFKAFFAYLVSPLSFMEKTTGSQVLLCLGFLLVCILVVVTLKFAYFGLGFRFQARERRSQRSADSDELIFAGAIAVFVLLSAAAAALLWIVRLYGVDDPNAPPYKVVMYTARYGAYSSFAYVILLCMFAQVFYAKVQAVVLAAASVFVLGVAITPTFLLKQNYIYDDEENISVAGLSVGLSPILPGLDGIWPSAGEDWYWKTELPKTVSYLRAEHFGPWRSLPDPYSTGNSAGNYVAVKKVIVTNVDVDVDRRRCAVSGVVSVLNQVLPSKSTLLPIVDGNRQVVGYGVLTRRSVGLPEREFKGFLFCSSAPGATSDMTLALDNVIWTPSERPEIIGSSPVELTDQTWLNGVARGWPGFVLKDTDANMGIYVPGRLVWLNDGQLRTIVRQDRKDGYLNVFVDGPLMSGKKVGYPHLIRPVN